LGFLLFWRRQRVVLLPGKMPESRAKQEKIE
jgi:hypothetical protein